MIYQKERGFEPLFKIKFPVDSVLNRYHFTYYVRTMPLIPVDGGIDTAACFKRPASLYSPVELQPLSMKRELRHDYSYNNKKAPSEAFIDLLNNLENRRVYIYFGIIFSKIAYKVIISIDKRTFM